MRLALLTKDATVAVARMENAPETVVARSVLPATLAQVATVTVAMQGNVNAPAHPKTVTMVD